jgi:hypothetical protein
MHVNLLIKICEKITFTVSKNYFCKNDLIMLRKFVLSAFLVFAATFGNAQQLETGNAVGSIGIGFGGYHTSGYGSSSPAFALQYEKGMWSIDGPGTISLGGYLGYQHYSSSYGFMFGGAPYTSKLSASYTILGIRSAYHYHGFTEKRWDPYAGLMLSYDIYSSSYTSNYNGVYDYSTLNDGGSKLGLSIYLGSRYYFSDNWAIYGELGYGAAYLTLGAAYHF